MHSEQLTLRLQVDYPDHAPRTESHEFTANKHQLVRKLNTPCFNPNCRSLDHREVHHFIVEWSEWDNTDPAKVLALAHSFDIYGYSALLGDKPIEGPDDIRNLMVLCAKCHRGEGTGIHLVPAPNWFSALVAKSGVVEIEPALKDRTHD